MTSPLLRLLAKDFWIVKFLNDLHIYEFLPRLNVISRSGTVLCSILEFVCDNILKYVMDADPEADNMDRIPVYLYHEPNGASTMDMNHFM